MQFERRGAVFASTLPSVVVRRLSPVRAVHGAPSSRTPCPPPASRPLIDASQLVLSELREYDRE